jgi:hypothetical protein
MRRLFPALLALMLCACSSDGSKADLVDDIGAVDLDVATDAVPVDGGEDVLASQEVDQTTPPIDGETEVIVVEGEFKLFTTAPAGDMRAIWGSDEALYAVGADGVILRRQGTTWTPMKSPTTKELRAIFGNGDDDIYAAGEKGTILHWDGTAWEEVDTSLELDLSDLSFNGVWGSEGQFYVVGDKGIILHYFEGKWKADDSLSSYNLGSIWGASLTDIYVGAAGGTVLRKIGGAWSSQQVTQGSITVNGLQALSSKSIFGGGTAGGIILHDTAGWTPKLSNDAYERTLHDVWAFGEDNVWMVGEDGALIHLEATKWNTAEIAGPFFKNHSFFGLWGREDSGNLEAWAVGEKGAVLYYDGETWADRTSSAGVDFNDIDGSDWENVVAVGGDGSLLRFDGTDWYGLSRLSESALQGIAEVDGTFVAVGEDGAVITVNGDLPTLQETGFETDLYGVCSGNGLIAVGGQGKMFSSDSGADWEPLSSGVFDTLRDCAFDDDGVLWAVGDLGKIVRLDGSEAEVIPVATIANLRRITVAPDGTLYAVGDNGLLLAHTADGWTKLYEEPGLFLYGVEAFDGVVHAVGWAGRIISYDPATGTVTPSEVPESGVLLQVWGADAGHLFAVGKKGKMLRFIDE